MSVRLCISVGLLAVGLVLAGCAGPAQVADTDEARFRAVDAALRDAGRMKVDRLAREVPLTPELLATNFAKTAFGEEFVLAGGLTLPADALSGDNDRLSGNLRKWTGPIRFALTDRVTEVDRGLVAGLTKRLARRTGLIIRPAGDERPNMFVRILGASDRAEIARAFRDLPEESPLAELFLAWAQAPEWPCAGEIYFSGPESDRRFEIALAMIYIRDEVRGLSRQACLEEEISQSLGLVRDDPTVRPSIFNDDEEFALLTRHDELLLQILYDPALAPGMDRATAAPIVARLAREFVQQ